MEAAVVGGLIKAVVPKLLSVVSDEYKLHNGASRNIEYLRWELLMIAAAIEDEVSMQGEHQQHRHSEVRPLLVQNLRRVAYGIEDCMDRIKYQTTKTQQSSLPRRGVRFPKKKLADRQIAAQMKRLRELADEAHKSVENYTKLQASSPVAHQKDEESSDPSILGADLVGIDGPVSHLLDQLAEAEGCANKHKVIAIVGFSGMGKTALAAKVYNRRRSSFDKHAWVSAADKRPAEVLTQLLHKLITAGAASAAGSSQGTSVSVSPSPPLDLPALQKRCAQQLMRRKYLVVIDDIRADDLWEKIKPAFPDHDGISSRIVITTTFQRVSIDCTSMKGYVLRMTRLDKERSKTLFCNKVSPTDVFKNHKHKDSDTISKKCRGQPLALVTVAQFMRINGWPTHPDCEHLCRNLNYHFQTDTTFKAMRQVLNRNYTSLQGDLKSCLLYFAMFPSDYQIRRGSLLRRWLAEEFVGLHPDGIPDPSTAFHSLMDRNIIEPTYYASNSERVKTCQTYGLMHEFILHMSISQKFATLLCDEKTEHKCIRRLSLHKNIATTDGSNLESKVLSLIRSLSVVGKANHTILDFSNYQLLRVLDLEKCDNLENDHLNNICGLVLLKYLSLGKGISILPNDITNLRGLQTLDLRGSDVNILPEEVLKMPGLIHLFGKFKVSDGLKPKSNDFLKETIRKFQAQVGSMLGKSKLAAEVKLKSHDLVQEKKSKLQTLAGFVADGRQDYMNLMDYMKELKKVKVWCEPSEGEGASTTNWSNLREAIQKFIHHDKQYTGVRSLSLHFGQCFGDSIHSLKDPCYLTSLKLYGKLHVLPQFVTSLGCLEELCVGLKSAKLEKGLLEALTKLGSLTNLKLIARDLDMSFEIEEGAFPSLQRLCFELECPTFPIIRKGSMPHLVTLQLLCKDMDGLCGIEIENLTTKLKEIILDHGVNSEIKDRWAQASKKHPNKPKVSSRITSLSGTTGNEEIGIIDHYVNSELSTIESLENWDPEEEPISALSVQQSTSYSDEFCRSRRGTNEESGTIDHGANSKLSTTESPENLVLTEEPLSGTSVQQSTSYCDDFSRFRWRHDLFAVPLPPILRLCFKCLMVCALMVLAVGWLQCFSQ